MQIKIRAHQHVPQSLKDGLEDYGFINTDKIIEAQWPHLKDKLAQKFSKAFMLAGDDLFTITILEALWKDITEVEKNSSSLASELLNRDSA